MNNTPDNIRNMWEQAANISEGMYGKLGGKAVGKMEDNASAQGRRLTGQEQGAAVKHAQNAGKAEITAAQQAAAARAADKAKRLANANADEKAGLNPGVGG